MHRKRSSSGWLDSPPGWMHLRPDHHQWRSNSTILHGSRSRCLHWFWHEFHGSCHQADAGVLLPHPSASVYPSVAHCWFFTRPGSSTDFDATRLLQRTPRWGAEVPSQPVVLCPAGCSSFDSAASSYQQCRKRDSHRAALAGCTCEGNFQAVLARSSVSSWVGSALPDPVLHTGQLNRWTLTSPFGRHGHGVCAGSQTSTIGPRAFAISSPSAWNSLPVDLRDPGLSLLTFRRRLKTYLFNPPG